MPTFETCQNMTIKCTTYKRSKLQLIPPNDIWKTLELFQTAQFINIHGVMTFHLSALRQDIKLMTFFPINIKHVHVSNVLHHNLNKEKEDILQMLLPFQLHISNHFRQALSLHFKNKYIKYTCRHRSL
jgi:hypothetical protein